MGFSYICLFGELMYAYFTCCPNIGYIFCCLSKFSTCQSKLHFYFLKGVAVYLKLTINWGIRYYCQAPSQHAGVDPGYFKDEHLPLPDGYPVSQIFLLDLIKFLLLI